MPLLYAGCHFGPDDCLLRDGQYRVPSTCPTPLLPPLLPLPSFPGSTAPSISTPAAIHAKPTHQVAANVVELVQLAMALSQPEPRTGDHPEGQKAQERGRREEGLTVLVPSVEADGTRRGRLGKNDHESESSDRRQNGA